MAVEPLTTVILVRHADRDVPTAGAPASPDPSLNAKGKKRAVKLEHVLSTAGIHAVYTSNFARTKQTAKPFLASRPALPVVRLNAATELRDHILANHAGHNVLVVGHSDTVPELIRHLGGPSLPVIDDCEFDNLFVVIRYSATKAGVAKLKYGETTSAPC